MDFAPDPRTEHLAKLLADFMDEFVYPAEPVYEEHARTNPDAWGPPPVIEELTVEARHRGLWNLFLPDDNYGAGLSNLQYAPLAEITGRSPFIAPEAVNCAPPDTGNMELLALFGTEMQRERWLEPLLDGRIRSAFAMTEPRVGSSDATNIETRIDRDGDSYRINGRKWFTSGGMRPDCAVFIVMGKTDPGGPPRRQQSMILVPRGTPGITVMRSMEVFGYSDLAHGGHAEVDFTNVRVPAENMIGEEGDGFALAQARLGPGRIHHCMRLIGMAERAVELMCHRAAARVTFGRALATRGVIREWVAEARVRIEMTRLLTLKAAWLMDTVGNKGAHTEIQAIKIAAPLTAEWVLDKAIQTFGGAGVSQDTPLAALWAHARTLRLADGPDEVHRAALGRREIARHAPDAGAA